MAKGQDLPYDLLRDLAPIVMISTDRSGGIWLADTYNVTPAYGPPVFPLLEHASILRLRPAADNQWTLSRVMVDTTCPRALALSPDERARHRGSVHR